MENITPRVNVLLLVLTAFTVALAQEDAAFVTLWQFGRHRLLNGHTTLAMQPLGITTDADGSATTYRYQVLNPATITTIEGGITTVRTTPSPTPRTIVASASGWVEFDALVVGLEATPRIACNFISAAFGQCTDQISTTTTIGNRGTPTPVVLTVGPPLTSAPSSAPTPSSTPTLASTPTSTVDSAPQSQIPVGAIVGATVGCAVLLVALALLLIWRRRRPNSSRVETDMAPRAYNIVRAPSHDSRTAGDKSRRPAASEATPTSGGVSSSQNNFPLTPDLSTTELARLLFQRVHANETQREEAPPEYPV
ncbi:hypothetical protein C8R43DRAFT_1017478 [Mycena crocata]|nr:hypothetical protein C8R43DRAFT_1017478 [Mycena crocata]